MERFYKAARSDGWDFWTGKTINYRDNIGKVVRRQHTGKVEACSSTALHASRTPGRSIFYHTIPCSLFLVEGRVYREDDVKCAFKQLKVIRELDPREVFKWRYGEAINPVNPLKVPMPSVSQKHLTWLREWALVERQFRWSFDSTIRMSLSDDDSGFAYHAVRFTLGGTLYGEVWIAVLCAFDDATEDNVFITVKDSVFDVCSAYTGYLFEPVVEKWKSCPGEDEGLNDYPFQSAVELWKEGLVPSFDGKVWRLHGGYKADILWEGEI